MVTSPLTDGPVELAFEISRERLICLYRLKYGINITPYLGATDPVRCHRCLETGFEFFAPADLAGPPEFYADLYSKENNELWAYQKEKWEYTVSARMVRPGSRVLDIGCGGGDFLATLAADVSRTGLETSSFGQDQTRAKGIEVVDSTIEDFARDHEGAFDVVTALQVLEHVAAPREFLFAAARALAPGGHLVIAVPNNDAFLGEDHELALNLPPHHMGRWNRRSLEAVADILKLPLPTIEYEPLGQNVLWYKATFEARFLPKSRILRSMWYRLGYSDGFLQFLNHSHHTIHGHTILAIYSKP